MTIVAILETLRGSKWVFIPAFTILCSIFLATTINSAAYTLSSQVTRELAGDQEPPRWNRTLWGLLLSLLALGLLTLGELKAVALSSLMVALPLIPVLILMIFSMMKWIKEDYGGILKERIDVLPSEKIKPVE